MKMYPFIVMARWHHRQLTLLLKKGRLSDDLEKTYEEYIEQNRPDAANLISARQDKQSAAFPGAARPGWPGTQLHKPDSRIRRRRAARRPSETGSAIAKPPLTRRRTSPELRLNNSPGLRPAFARPSAAAQLP